MKRKEVSDLLDLLPKIWWFKLKEKREEEKPEKRSEEEDPKDGGRGLKESGKEKEMKNEAQKPSSQKNEKSDRGKDSVQIGDENIGLSGEEIEFRKEGEGRDGDRSEDKEGKHLGEEIQRSLERTEEKSEENSEEGGHGSPSIKVPNSIPLSYIPNQRIAAAFRSFILKIMEVDEVNRGRELPGVGTTKYSVRRMMKRKMQRKPLRYAKADYEKEVKPVIFVYDTSGSMIYWLHVVNSAVVPLVRQKLIHLFTAPNGISIEEIRVTGGRLEAKRPLSLEELLKEVEDKRVIYFGDFDGGDTVYHLGKHAKEVIWICTETRYEDTADHSWCSYSLDEYPDTVRVFFVENEKDLLLMLKGKRKEGERKERDYWEYDDEDWDYN